MTLLERRASNAAKQQRRRERMKPVFQAIIANFLDRPCEDCGVQYSRAAMHPDHVRGKKYKIAWFSGGNGSTSALLEELGRCEVRCANCHAIRHAKDRS